MKSNTSDNIPNNNLPDNMEGKIFKPQFIPIYTDIRDRYKLTRLQAEVYGFVRVSIEKFKIKFMFTNKHLAYIHSCSEVSINKTISELVEKNLIKKYNQVRPNGGVTRYIYLIPTDNSLSFSNDNSLSPNNNLKYNYINKEKTKITEEQIDIEYKLLSDYLDGKTDTDNLPMYW